MIPNGYRFIGIAPEVDLKERGSALLNKRTEPFTLDEIRGYKVFTALLTQSGGDDPIILYFDDTPGGPDLTIGVTYQISDNTAGLDVTNIGAPNNTVGTSFVATGTRPTNWGEGSLTYNTGAPVATVLENTIGNVWFEYTDVGIYNINSYGLLLIDKRQFYYGLLKSADNANGSIIESDIAAYNNNFIQIITLDNGENAANGMNNIPIEIRVYN